MRADGSCSAVLLSTPLAEAVSSRPSRRALYESIGTDPIVLTRTEVAATGQLTDLRFRV